jgi:hypothetical protein
MTDIIPIGRTLGREQALTAILLNMDNDEVDVTTRIREAVGELAFGEISDAEQVDIKRGDGLHTTGVVAREALDGIFEGFLWVLRSIDRDGSQQLAAHYLDRMTVEARGGRAAA